MSLVHTHNFGKSLRYAARGIRYVYAHERNFQIHVVFAVVAVVLGWILHVSQVEWLFILTAIASVMALEIVNTIFEKFVDMFQPRVHHYAEVIKDLMAGAVLIASLSALAVGLIIFLPLIITRFT